MWDRGPSPSACPPGYVTIANVFGKPEIPDETIVAAMGDAYGLAVSIEFLPLGRDSNAWVYRAATAGGEGYFLKVRRWPLNEAGIVVPPFLYDHGIDQALAAIPTATGSLWQRLGQFVLVVYPFVEGASGMDRRLTDNQWVEYGEFLRALHEIRLPADLERLLPRESYRPDYTDVLRRLLARGPDERHGDAAQVKLAAFWQSRRDEIALLLERAETLGVELASKSPELVLCHADIHRGNLLIDRQDRLRVVDWDGLVLAPRERDLMFIVEGVVVPPKVEPHEQALFFSGYGSTDLDWPALAYYRHVWAVQDIAEFAHQVFSRARADEPARARAAETFVGLFAPGDEVDSAHESYDRLGGGGLSSAEL